MMFGRRISPLIRSKTAIWEKTPLNELALPSFLPQQASVDFQNSQQHSGMARKKTPP